MARTPKAGEGAAASGSDPPSARKRRAAAARDRGGVDEIEGLPASFTFKRRDHADADRREAKAIITALQTRPGEDAMVKRFQKADKAAAFADFLRAIGEESGEWTLDVHAETCEVFAMLSPAPQTPPKQGEIEADAS